MKLLYRRGYMLLDIDIGSELGWVRVRINTCPTIIAPPFPSALEELNLVYEMWTSGQAQGQGYNIRAILRASGGLRGIRLGLVLKPILK